MKSSVAFVLASMCTIACFSEANDLDSSSGSSTTGNEAASSTASTTTTSSSSGTSDASSSETADPSVTGSVTSADSSSGGDAEHYAILFDGGLAETAATGLANFDDAPFTIEMWISAPAPFEGVLFDTTVDVLDIGNGMFFAVAEEYFGQTLVAFQNLGVDAGVAPIMFGPDASELSGWHHLAVTQQADGTHRMWLDGLLVQSVLSPTPIDNVDSGTIVIGSRATTPFPPLTGVAVDELRLSNEALYTTDFAPARPLGGGSSHDPLLGL